MSHLALETYVGLDQPEPAGPGRVQDLDGHAGWPGVRFSRATRRLDGHTDQVIIVGSLILGFWLIAKSIYLVVT